MNKASDQVIGQTSDCGPRNAKEQVSGEVLVDIKVASRMLGYCTKYLQQMDRAGSFQCYVRSETGRRLYTMAQLELRVTLKAKPDTASESRPQERPGPEYYRKETIDAAAANYKRAQRRIAACTTKYKQAQDRPPIVYEDIDF